ncbi:MULTISPECIES: hypothetical protein [Moorena]|uniref:Uncharacterized protein n=1 Tax=Moorena producens 3L TaxID=489825 RepID=F4XK18_9CYAN|nr:MULTISPECIES: hypothetical protein [Moorena]EGJ34977.1 hypothetical protein LYNGBM3L_09200 [Moorena producens 3L]
MGFREQGLRKREEGRGKREEGRGKREEGRGKKICVPHEDKKRYIPFFDSATPDFLVL